MRTFVEDNETWNESILPPIREDGEKHPKNLERKSWTEGKKYHMGYYTLCALELFT